MAGLIIGDLVARLTGDSTAWTSEFKKAESSVNSFIKTVQSSGRSLEDFNAKTASMWMNWQNNIGKSTGELVLASGKVISGLKANGVQVDITAKQFADLAVKEGLARQEQKLFNQQLKTLTNSLWLTTAGLKQFGNAMTIGFTVPIVAAGTAAIKVFADWQDAMIAVQRVALLTSADAQKMLNSFIDISVSSPLTVDNLLKMAKAAGEAGITGEENIAKVSKALSELMYLSADFGSDTTKMAELMGKTMTAFDISADKIDNLTSLFYVAAIAIPGGITEITNAIIRASGSMGIYGVNVANAMAVMTAALPVMGSASRAGTEMASVFTLMSTKIGTFAEMMGYSVKEMQEKLEKDAFGTLIEFVRRLTETGSAAQAQQFIYKQFGQSSGKVIMALYDQYDKISPLQKELNEAWKDGTA